jgi:hypothetical protein
MSKASFREYFVEHGEGHTSGSLLRQRDRFPTGLEPSVVLAPMGWRENREVATRRLVFILVALFAFSCGARTSLVADVASDASGGARVLEDAAVQEHADTLPDAAGCPPVPTEWSESVVATAVTSYALARDDRCGVFVLSADASMAVDVARLDERGGWTHSPLGVSAQVVTAAAADSTLHVLFFEGTSLHYVSWHDGLLGMPELVDALGLARGEVVVGASGAVHAIYPAVNGTLSELHYAVRRGGVWGVERVDARQSFEPSLALTHDEKPLVAYEYVASQEEHACVLATRGDKAWSLLDLPRVDTYYSSNPCTVRVGHDDVVHLAYGAYGSGSLGPVLRHAFGTFDALRFENVEPLAWSGDDPGSASLDANGGLHVAYRAKGGALLRAGVLRAGAAPAIETVSTKDSQGVLVVVDGAGVTNVAAYREGNLIVARRGP